jgi:hypothetical protein
MTQCLHCGKVVTSFATPPSEWLRNQPKMAKKKCIMMTDVNGTSHEWQKKKHYDDGLFQNVCIASAYEYHSEELTQYSSI